MGDQDLEIGENMYKAKKMVLPSPPPPPKKEHFTMISGNSWCLVSVSFFFFFFLTVVGKQNKNIYKIHVYYIQGWITNYTILTDES